MKYRCYLFLLIPLFFISGVTRAQTVYGNEWIDLNQSYYKISVVETGIYKIDQAALLAAGVPLGSINPSTLQLWHRGVQQSIEVFTENPGTFGSNDYFLFYGQRNDGTLDTLVYSDASDRLNPYYNLFSDTAAYFLTWGSTGNRVAQHNITTSETPIAYHFNEQVQNYDNIYSKGYVLELTESYDSWWGDGEGWCGSTYTTTTTSTGSTSYTFSTPNLYSSGPDIELEVRVAGRNSHFHATRVTVGSGSNAVDYQTDNFSQYTSETEVFSNIPVTTVASNQLIITLTALGNTFDPDNQAPVYYRLKYPEVPNMSTASEKIFLTPSNVSDTSLLSIQNPGANLKVWDITDLSDVRNLLGTSGATHDVAIPNTSTERKILAFDSNDVKTPSALEEITFSNDTAANYDFILLSHPVLDSSATLYEQYRESVAGGDYTVLKAYVDRIYNQYGYGEKSPYAIRRFMNFLIDHGTPEYLFILGKSYGIDLVIGDRGYYRKNPEPYGTNDWVPTMGNPGSDILFVNHMGGAGIEPAIGVGRFAAWHDEHAIAYLNKVKEHELVPVDALWRKNIVHISGGVASEADLFLNYVNSFKSIAEGPFLGANVTTFSKSSSAEVEFFNISEAVNNGVQLVTFFGHSSSVVADVDIGFASRVENGYLNQGRYPCLLINGCSSGNMFIGSSLGEDWMSTPDKGAIAVIAHSDLGYATQFSIWSDKFYETAYADTNYLGMPIGDIHRATMRKFDNLVSGNRATVHLQQMNLQGDPALVLFPAQKPDYFIDDSRVSIQSIDGEPVTAVSDSFIVQIIPSNFGLAVADSFAICIDRTYNNGQNMVRYGPEVFPPVYYQDTLEVIIRSKDPLTFGQNTFNIIVDCLDSLDEISEVNNTANINYFVPLSSVNGLSPINFTIVGNDTVDFLAQSTDLLISQNTEYVFQLDTNDAFANPLMELEATSGSLVSWSDLPLPVVVDSIVYYWRVRFKNLAAGEDTLWDLNSFTYIDGKNGGWSQGHYQQFREDTKSGISQDFSLKQWVFDSTQANIFANTAGQGAGGKEHLISVISVNGQALFEWGNSNNCIKDGLMMVAFDRTSVIPYNPFGFDAGTCGNSPAIVSAYSSVHDGGASSVIGYLDEVQEGDFVLFMTIGNNSYSSWSTAVKDSIKDFGAQSLDLVSNSAPYLLLGRKGASTPILEVVGANAFDTITVGNILSGQQINATIETPLIGPASSWNDYYHQFSSSSNDAFTVDITGVDLDENETHLTTISGSNDVDSLDISALAANYPYIKLTATVSDSVTFNPPQLQKWMVCYTGVPEGTINPSIVGLEEYTISPKGEGDSVQLNFAFQNISDFDFTDSLIVRYVVTNTNSGSMETVYDTLNGLVAGDTLLFNHSVATSGFTGENSLHIYVNPKIVAEQSYNNNILVLNFEVDRDDVHPILDVVFDGQHILDGDIVSANPFVTITMHDENDLLYKTDTTGIEIFLKRPCTDPDPLTGCPFEQILLSDPSIAGWYPAGPESDFKVEYNPQNLEDGTYTLMVQVQDASGNKSGYEPYVINFQVINEASVTNVLPYPNPFSTSTRFVFTLTGSQVPDRMKIQIMTVSGRVVRTITQDELGPLRIGNNITQFAWDGTDEYGDKLANGTYLYTVDIEHSDGESINHRATKADQGFKKNFGKLVIIR